MSAGVVDHSMGMHILGVNWVKYLFVLMVGARNDLLVMRDKSQFKDIRMCELLPINEKFDKHETQIPMCW